MHVCICVCAGLHPPTARHGIAAQPFISFFFLNYTPRKNTYTMRIILAAADQRNEDQPYYVCT
jgi:hypothetical protein